MKIDMRGMMIDIIEIRDRMISIRDKEIGIKDRRIGIKSQEETMRIMRIDRIQIDITIILGNLSSRPIETTIQEKNESIKDFERS